MRLPLLVILLCLVSGETRAQQIRELGTSRGGFIRDASTHVQVSCTRGEDVVVSLDANRRVKSAMACAEAVHLSRPCAPE